MRERERERERERPEARGQRPAGTRLRSKTDGQIPNCDHRRFKTTPG